jgi:peptidoglycan hydrolase-like protein with peptidoglycan-binding domain
MALSYANAGLRRGAAATDLVRDLQRDLRALGYLRQGIDGGFGDGTDAAVRRLQYDLLNNDGSSTRNDGNAPVAIRDYNHARVTDATGVVDPGLAACIEELLRDPNAPKLPSALDAAAANRQALATIAAAPSSIAPTPFLLAIFQQESDARQYIEPTSHDADNFVTVGLDYLAETPNRVTSRGYGIGQYTLFHHPPRPDEVSGVITDPARNVQNAYALLRDKFDHFLRGGTPDTTADDLVAEHPAMTGLRLCRYRPGDARYLRDCRTCALQGGKQDLAPDTPVYAGAAQTYAPAPHYAPTTYRGVPVRGEFLCDWPYAARRYNGSGPDSYNYQARVLLNLLATPPQTQVS